MIRNNDKTDGNSLIGEFVYSGDGTIYEFQSNQKGAMKSGDHVYEFSYSTTDDELSIDFENNSIKDVKYKYNIKNGTLTLVSVEGTITIGEEYKLEKKSK